MLTIRLGPLGFRVRYCIPIVFLCSSRYHAVNSQDMPQKAKWKCLHVMTSLLLCSMRAGQCII